MFDRFLNKPFVELFFVLMILTILFSLIVRVCFELIGF